MKQLYSMIKKSINNDFKGKPVYIFDYDGTLSDGAHRLDKLPKTDPHLTESWIEFNSLSRFDSPFNDTISVMNSIYDSGAYIIILTGRSDHVLDESLDWLTKNGCKYNVMVMRSASDNRKDTIIKEEFLNSIGIERITAAWDDSPNVINHFRSLGITTYQVCDYGYNVHSGLKSHGVENLNSK
ncbi:polynucleotide kinase [Escherichia phage TR2]|nr:polynucleotide kinase [Escherichia phage TR2]